jgi:8-oxo-dGTP pyrophosphatase MutT (NUDIX family)
MYTISAGRSGSMVTGLSTEQAFNSGKAGVGQLLLLKQQRCCRMVCESGSSAGMPAEPRDAATLILLRDSDQPSGRIEVLLLKRHARSAFLPGVHVFPGGVVEEADSAPEMAALCQGLSFDQAHRIIKDVSPPEKSLGFFVAAIREAFEESGIILAHSQRPIDERQMMRLGGYRAKVHANPATLVSRLGDEALKLATDKLYYFAHWITPEVLPIRFDARFFVAAASSGQEASPDGKETVQSRWISPRDALEEHQKGSLKLAPPTFHSLSELAGFATAGEAIASTHGKLIVTRHG